MADSGRNRPPHHKRRPVQSNPEGRIPGQRPARKVSGPRRRKHSGVLIRLLTMFLIVAVFILGVAIFFKVTDIQVQGNALYASEDVVQASGIEQGDNLMTLSKTVAAGKIMAVLPYVEKVWITRILPGTVVIEVQESDAAYAVAAEDGTSWLMNSSGKVLEQASTSAADYPKLTGVTAQNPEVGSQIATEQQEALLAAQTVMEQLENTDYISQIAEINVEKPYDIVVWYGNQYEIELGSSDDMEYKIQYLTAIFTEPTAKDKIEGQSGVIDLTFQEEKVAHFRPWQDNQNLNTDLEGDLPDNSSDNS